MAGSMRPAALKELRRITNPESLERQGGLKLLKDETPDLVVAIAGVVARWARGKGNSCLARKAAEMRFNGIVQAATDTAAAARRRKQEQRDAAEVEESCRRWNL